MAHIYQPTDVVLAKVKGYPAWPALIVPTELIPEHILRSRSKNHNSLDKSSNPEAQSPVDDAAESDEEDPRNYIVYSSILKFRKFDTQQPQYCVKFFCDDSYIWVKNSDLKLLTPDDCESWLQSTKRKNKKLIPAFEMAKKGSENIDVWEFVEYGSIGKPDEEEYLEEEEDLDELNSELDYEEDEDRQSRPKPKRVSERQSRKRRREAELDAKKNQRKTRSRNSIVDEEVEESLSGGEPQDDEIMEIESKKARSSNKRQVKGKSKTNAKRAAKAKPVVEKYHYEDDEDWTIVGMGLQDLSAQKHVSPIVNRLSQKKNFERHLEIKLDLIDRLLSINKLIIELVVPQVKKKAKNSKQDYELILDELELALSMKGANGEFITVFQSNAELLTNFRLLFNLRQHELKSSELWSPFQTIFVSIFDCEFVPDQIDWSSHPDSPSGKKELLEMQSTQQSELEIT